MNDFKTLSLVIVMSAGLVLAGCGKKEAAPAVTRSAPAAVSVSGEGDPAAPATAAAVPAPSQNQGIDTASAQAPEVPKGKALIPISPTADPELQAKLLTDALNVWEDWNGGKAPKALSQLAEKKIIDQVPMPPQGKKFVIDAVRHVVRLEGE